MVKITKIRLFVQAELTTKQAIKLSREQTRYLLKVMRKNIGDSILIFNGRHGEWLGTINSITDKYGVITCIKQQKLQQKPADLWLLFAPVKKKYTDSIIQKATELGVGKIIPVCTDYTNVRQLHQSRLYIQARQAAEQCGSMYIPTIHSMQPLATLLHHWPDNRPMIFCNENNDEKHRLNFKHLANKHQGIMNKAAILIGPEGGFSPTERKILTTNDFVTPIHLGPRILRADTAASVAIALWQNTFGDWKNCQ